MAEFWVKITVASEAPDFSQEPEATLISRPSPPMEPKQFNHWTPYHEHSKTLRTWLVAYGIGMPSLLATQETFGAAVVSSGRAPLAIGLFLTGVAVQIIVVMLNKYTQGYLYFGEEKPEVRSSTYYKWSEGFSEKTWPLVVADGLTISLFVLGTYFIVMSMIRLAQPN